MALEQCPPKLDWKTLVEHLRCQSPFLYIQNPGNAGDALIYLGFEELMRKHEISFEEYSPEKYRAGNKRLVYSGGGNLVGLYEDCRDVIKQHHDDLESFTLLPHTISENEDLLPTLDQRYTLFCRDLPSHEHCQELLAPDVSVHLSHDLALVLCEGDYPKSYPKNFPHPTLRRKIRWLKELSNIRKSLQSGNCNFYRTDVESSGQPLPASNIDISRALSITQKSISQRHATANAFLFLLDKANEIHTDRLHVAIAGALLGKKTYLQGNCYYKNQAIYEHSLAGRFPLCSFLKENSRPK